MYCHDVSGLRDNTYIPISTERHMCIVRISYSIAWEHWPDTLEFITRSAVLWYRWIRPSCYYNREYNKCSLYTHVSPILLCIGTCNLFCSFRSIFVYNCSSYNCTQIISCVIRNKSIGQDSTPTVDTFLDCRSTWFMLLNLIFPTIIQTNAYPWG